MPLINNNTPWASRNPFSSLQGVGKTPVLSAQDLALVTRNQTGDQPMQTQDNSQPTVAPLSLAGATNALPDLVTFVKEQEGFEPKAFADYGQTNIGYGTAAKHPNEVISQQEAESRLIDELSKRKSRISQTAQNKGWNLNDNQLNALTSFDFNTDKGTYLLNTSKDLNQVKNRMGQYTHAGGKELPGLVARRQQEMNWWG